MVAARYNYNNGIHLCNTCPGTVKCKYIKKKKKGFSINLLLNLFYEMMFYKWKWSKSEPAVIICYEIVKIWYYIKVEC